MHLSLVMLLLIFGGSVFAGVIGSLVGLGGGVLLVPMLTLAFGLPIQYAIGTSIVAVIATSSGSAAAYFLAGFLVSNVLFLIFGVVLFISAVPLIFKIGEELPKGVRNDCWANWLHLSSSYPDRQLGREVPYQVTRTPVGLAMMYVAGVLSGLLGIGSGSLKVLAMDTIMRLPMKVSTTTSNFMIGVTAAASAGIYFSRGDIPPLIAAPVALGVLLGAFIGSHLLTRVSNKTLRLIFLPVLAVIAFQMVMRGLGIVL